MGAPASSGASGFVGEKKSHPSAPSQLSATAPKMMSVGLHMRLIGHPARAVGLARLLDHIQKHSGVWVTRRVDIARHWIKTHPYAGKGLNE